MPAFKSGLPERGLARPLCFTHHWQNTSYLVLSKSMNLSNTIHRRANNGQPISPTRQLIDSIYQSSCIKHILDLQKILPYPRPKVIKPVLAVHLATQVAMTHDTPLPAVRNGAGKVGG